MKEKYDFSKASSRESGSADGTSSGSAGSAAATAAPTEFVDPLLSFIQKAGTAGATSGRIGQSYKDQGMGSNDGGMRPRCAWRRAGSTERRWEGAPRL